MKGIRIRTVTGIKTVNEKKNGIKMRKSPVRRTNIVTIRIRNTSPVPRIRIGKIGTRRRIKKEIETKIKIGIRVNIVLKTRTVTVVPRINIGIRRGTKTNIPETRIGRIEKRKVIFLYIF